MVKACALIAAYNEEGHVAEVVTGTLPYVAAVFVVDDGSSDETAARAREAGATVLVHPSNLGKGHAIRTGLAALVNTDFTHVVFLDADLQHDPAEIPALLAAAEKGADFVIGERELIRSQMPASRYYSNVVGSRVLSSFIGTPVSDTQSGFRVVAMPWLRRLRLTGTGYEIETEMLIKLTRGGASVARVKVARLHYAGVKSHIRPFRDTCRTCFLAVWYRYLEPQPRSSA
jgi:glycosyltransferase involved in cell wall biosynthesis